MTTNAARRGHLRLAPTAEDILRDEIAELGAQIDRHLGNPPGTATRGIYFWLSSEDCSAAVLTTLHADAAQFLCEVVLANALPEPPRTDRRAHRRPR